MYICEIFVYGGGDKKHCFKRASIKNKKNVNEFDQPKLVIFF